MPQNIRFSAFSPISSPFMHGFQRTRPDGITVELVRCEAGQWNVFITRSGSVVARSVAEYRRAGNGYLPYAKARQIALSLV